MTTKSELLALLASTYANMTTPTVMATDSYNGTPRNVYNVNVMKITGNGVTFFNLNFYVMDEGGAGEAAYFDYNTEPEELRTV